LPGLLLFVRSKPGEELRADGDDLFGLSPALEALFDDLPDLSSRLFPGLLDTIFF
jgi:hypothetical protein